MYISTDAILKNVAYHSISAAINISGYCDNLKPNTQRCRKQPEAARSARLKREHVFEGFFSVCAIILILLKCQYHQFWSKVGNLAKSGKFGVQLPL
jgi:hypothetical protein